MPTLRSDLAEAVLLGVTCAALVLLGGQMLFGAAEVGLSVDDYTHALRTDAWAKTGWYFPEYAFVGGEPDPSRAGIYTYGAATSALAHLVNVALGNEGMGEALTTADAYEGRHVVVALLGLASVVAVGAGIWSLTRNWLAAIWGSAALVAIPGWTGYAMFAIKDIPVAAGFTFVTLGLILGLAQAGSQGRPAHGRTIAIGALVAIGVLFGVGTRPAMWVPILASLTAFGVLAWWATRSRVATARHLAAPGLGFAFGIVGVVALHPRLAGDPIKWLIESVSGTSEAARENVFTLTAGQFLSEFPPAWYLPAWTFASVPVLIFLIAAGGTMIAARDAVRSRPAWSPNPARSVAVNPAVLLVGLQLLLLPAAAIISGSATYSGLRQHLYILPPIAILAGIAAARLLREGPSRNGRPRRVGWGAALILCLALIVPAIEQTRLYPYNYVYINELAGIGGVEGRWETEQQFISVREAFRRVPRGVEPK
ncbi:MAG: hypothetical protein ACRDJ9_26405, partial [Dehalococcoidia bacterium]